MGGSPVLSLETFLGLSILAASLCLFYMLGRSAMSPSLDKVIFGVQW